MAAIPGSVRVGGFIAPSDSTDTYPVTDETYGRGGYRSVEDNTERDAITAPRRKEGMLVRTTSTNKLWVLGAGLTNADWTEQSVSGAAEEYEAAENIGGHQAVALNALGQLIRASADNPLHRHVEGLTLNAVTSGDNTPLVRNGSLEHLGWTFTPGLPVFLGLSGALTQTVPGTAVFCKVLGLAVTSTRMTVDIQPAIFI